jgi:prevent-host-death family protein
MRCPLEATFASMRRVGLKTLKNKLSEYVRLAASGETIVITDRDRIVAEIVPPRRDTNTFSSAGYVRGGFPLRQIRLANLLVIRWCPLRS